ncbi:29624_t:CDS:1, partial [Racocetra persica]
VIKQPILSANSSIQKISTNLQQPLADLEISKRSPPKCLKSLVELYNKQSASTKSDEVTYKTCGYCTDKGYNICECSKYKANLVADKEN